jgi:hypothetical protein
MDRFTKYITLILLLLVVHVRVHAAGETRPSTEAETKFYSSTVVPVVDTVKNAMPAEMAGWVKASESTLPVMTPGEMSRLHFQHLVIYKRVAGVDEEQKRLKNIYAQSSRKHEEEARTAIEELIDQQSETASALRKATKRKNQSEIDRLNNELDENGRKMSALHKDVDDEIAHDVEPYLVKDAEASIRVSVNYTYAEFPAAEPFIRPKAAFALRKEGEKIGATGWNEGQIMLLYGDWQKAGEDSYRANIDLPPFTSSVKTISIVISGKKERIDDLLQRMDLNTILSLMK